MKVKCENCNKEDIGRYKKLVKRGWKIFFLFEGVKVIRCKNCKPKMKDKIKMIFDKNYKPEMYYGIKDMIGKLKLLKGLQTKEELRKESIERKRRKHKHYHYQRHIHKKKGSESMGFINRRIELLGILCLIS